MPHFLSWDQLLDRFYAMIDVRRRPFGHMAEAQPRITDGAIHARE